MKKAISLVLVLVLDLTAEIANADFTLGTHIPLLDAYTLGDEYASSISSDSLSLYFTSSSAKRPSGYGSYDIWVTSRATISDPWREPVNLGPKVNSSQAETKPSISSDGLSLYFSDGVWIVQRPRSGGYGGADLWVTTRSTFDSDWDPPVNLGSIVNSSATEGAPSISSDGLCLFFESERPGGSGSYDIWMTSRAIPNGEWGAPVNLGPVVNSPGLDVHADISADGLALFFQSDRSGSLDLWLTLRVDVSDTFGPPIRIAPTIEYPNTSDDGQTLFFTMPANWDLWQVPILPTVDFNGDGIVDAADMCIMVDHWGEDNPLCDIGPMPWGDGIVNVQDLIVLAEHLFEEREE